MTMETLGGASPQDAADFSKLRCWFFSTKEREPSVAALLDALSMTSEDIKVPTAFMGRFRLMCFGPHCVLPRGYYPDVVVIAAKEANGLVKYVKQQSPTTYIISIHAAHPYADLSLLEEDLASPAATGLVRGHLLRHLNALH